MKNVGIITYHAAYNYGSALQAFATQESIKKLGYNAEILNYRFAEQKNIYSNYRWKCGARKLLKDIFLIPLHSKRQTRKQRFETFINKVLNTTEEFSEPCQFPVYAKKYDVLVSGSDQIWNKHSLELENIGWDYMFPYLLEGITKPKVSYASSLANMSDKDLDSIKDKIQKFDAISVRESDDVNRISQISNCNVEWVVDPTLLISREEWIGKLKLEKKDKSPFVLFYSLSVGYKELEKVIRQLRIYAKKTGLHVCVINPYILIKSDKEIELFSDLGPIEFLNMIYNADAVITDSYHGTVLSVAFQKNIFSICKAGKSENRKRDFLYSVGLESRAISKIEDINQDQTIINYDTVSEKISKRREASMNYLKQALK